MRHVDIGFVGWPGDEDDPTVQGIRDVAHATAKLVIVTLGVARRPRLRRADRRVARTERRIPVTPVEVAGTTVGCGDAFIAAFLGGFWRARDVDGRGRGGQGRGRRGDRLAAAHPRRGVRARRWPSALRLADEEA